MSIVLDTKDFKENVKPDQGQVGSYGEVASTVLGSGSSNNTGSSNNVGSLGNVGSIGSVGSVGSNPNVGESNNLVSSGAIGSSAVNIETAEKPVVYKQYAYRFVIMFIYFAISNAGSITGTTCAPIITNLTKMYGISQVQVNLANLLGMIVYIPATIPGNYILDTWGIRIGMWIGTLLLVAGAWVRMLATSNFTWVILGNLLAALGGPLIANCPQKISAYWNGPKSRTMFTTLLVLSGALGGSIGTLIPGIYIGEESSPEIGRPRFLRLMLIEAIVASAMCVPMLLFREKPPTPPSASAATQREDFRKGVKTVFKNKNFLWLLAQQGCVLGALNALATVMQSLVDPFGITQAQAATLGVILTVACVVGCLIIGIFVEKTKKFKLATVMSSIVGLAGFGLFLGVLYAESFIGIAVALAFLGFMISPSGPLCLEFACELTFPVGEATSGGVILCVIQVFCPAMSFSISAIMEMEDKRNGTLYSMIMLMGFMVLGALFSLKIKEDLVRSRLDNKHAKKVEEAKNAGNNPETPCPMLDKPDPSPTPKDEIKS